MKHILLAAGLLGAFVLPSGLAQSPVPLPQRNPVNLKDKNPPTEFSVAEGEEKNLLWKATLGDICYAGPVVAGDKVFVGTNNTNPRDPKIKGDKGVVMCFSRKDGKFLWQAVHDKLSDTQENDFPNQGVASTPVVDGDRLYYVSNRCELVCADVNGDGKGGAKFLWKLDMMGQLKVFPRQLANSSPLVVDDLVYVVTSNGRNEEKELPSPKAPSFIAVNKKTGKVEWQDSSPGEKIIEGQWSCPVYAVIKGVPQVIFPGGDGYLYAFEPKKGKLLWKFNTSVKEDGKREERSPPSYPVATPVVYEDRVYVGVSGHPDVRRRVGHLWCIDPTKEPKNADRDLSSKQGDFDPASAANKDSGLVWHYGGLIVPRPMRGRDTVFGPTFSTACIADGLLYIAEEDGYLHCLDAKTGKKYWDHDFTTGTWATPYWVDGKIYLGNDDGDLMIFTHGKEKKDPIKVALDSGPIHTPVVVVDGVLYVSADRALFAIGKK